MAIRAADENGKARGGFKKNEPFSLSFFFTSIQRRDGKMSHTDMSGDGKRGE